MSSVSLVEFQFKRVLLASRPLRDKKELLLGVGSYYQETIGSEIDERYVLETEHFLNDLYLKAVKESAQYELQEMIINAGGLASSLSYAIKHNNLDYEFFGNAKRLGVALINISYSIT
jgi:hypothetical protein